MPDHHAIAEQDRQILTRGLNIANVAVIQAVTSECPTQKAPGGAVLYDTRPMLDPREHSSANIDWFAELLSYGETTGLIARDSADRHLVRFVRQGR